MRPAPRAGSEEKAQRSSPAMGCETLSKKPARQNETQANVKTRRAFSAREGMRGVDLA